MIATDRDGQNGWEETAVRGRAWLAPVLPHGRPDVAPTDGGPVPGAVGGCGRAAAGRGPGGPRDAPAAAGNEVRPDQIPQVPAARKFPFLELNERHLDRARIEALAYPREIPIQ